MIRVLRGLFLSSFILAVSAYADVNASEIFNRFGIEDYNTRHAYAQELHQNGIVLFDGTHNPYHIEAGSSNGTAYIGSKEQNIILANYLLSGQVPSHIRTATENTRIKTLEALISKSIAADSVEILNLTAKPTSNFFLSILNVFHNFTLLDQMSNTTYPSLSYLAFFAEKESKKFLLDCELKTYTTRDGQKRMRLSSNDCSSRQVISGEIQDYLDLRDMYVEGFLIRPNIRIFDEPVSLLNSQR